MPETPPPVVVYNRIDANRRKTRLLLISFVVALLPVVLGCALLIFPLIHLMYAAARPASMEALAAHARTVQPIANGTYRLADLAPLLWLYGGFFFVSMAIVVMVLVATIDRLVSNYGSSVVLRLARARPVDALEEPDLVHLVENLCIGAGLPVPSIHVIESAAPNAFATGLHPHDASLVVTRGLLELLDRRQLAGVIAHGLSHIGNHDIALSTTLAALIGTVSLPLNVLSAPLRIAFRMPGALRVIVGSAVILAFVEHNWLLTAWGTASVFIYFMQYYLPQTADI